MSTCPRGLIGTEFHIHCNAHCLAWDEQTRSSGRKGSHSAWRGEGAGGGIFQDLSGLCWHPVRLCYQLQLGIMGYSRGILGCWWGGMEQTWQENIQMKCAFDLRWMCGVVIAVCLTSVFFFFLIHCEICFSFQSNVSLSNFFIAQCGCWRNYHVKKKEEGSRDPQRVSNIGPKEQHMPLFNHNLFLFSHVSFSTAGKRKKMWVLCVV